MDVTCGDIKQAYLSAPTSETHWINLNSDFLDEKVK